MKKYLLVSVIIFNFSLISAQESPMLECSRSKQILTKINENNDKPVVDCDIDRYLEISANEVFGVELNYFDENVVNKIMLDDISSPNWLTKKGIYELRENQLCLEEICQKVWNKCNNGINQSRHLKQKQWCENAAQNIFEIQKIKVETAILENQRRKNRSTVREKFRAIEVRSRQYFFSNLINFSREFKRFTEKVTAFILNPLQ